MKIFSSDQLRAWDKHTCAAEPITSSALVQRAADCFSQWFLGTFHQKSVLVVCGKGNNGADGMAIARILHLAGRHVQVYVIDTAQNPSADFSYHHQLLELAHDVQINFISSIQAFETPSPQVIIIDALFGTGLNRPADGLYAQCIEQINRFSNRVISVDIPSGMFADKKSSGCTVEADYTFSFEVPKLACLCPENGKYVGNLLVQSIQLCQQFETDTASNMCFFQMKDAKRIMKSRATFSHKGTNGKALIVGGSKGKMGAAFLAAKACLYAGAGTVTAQIPKSGTSSLNVFCPEIMSIADPDEDIISTYAEAQKFDAVAFGPGCGTANQTQKAFEQLLRSSIPRFVIDADGLNLLAEYHYMFNHVKHESILTPHPGEFARLFGQFDDSFQRWEVLRRHAVEKQLIIVLKGAYTAIAFPNGNISFNESGNSALATAGSGDVLTGIICALLAQRYTPHEAAALAVYLHGLAADIYQEEIAGERMVASQIIEYLHKAFARLLLP